MNMHYPAFSMPETSGALPLDGRCDSNLARVLAAGEFAVTGELGPPKGHDPEAVRKKARLLEGCVDAANITDNQTAVVRMSSIAAGLILLESGIEPVIQMTCRDRNRLAIQSDLLGAYALGIRNLLCLSGDHQSGGNHPGAKNVHDIDSMQLIRMVNETCATRVVFQCGEEIRGGGPRLLHRRGSQPLRRPPSRNGVPTCAWPRRSPGRCRLRADAAHLRCCPRSGTTCGGCRGHGACTRQVSHPGGRGAAQERRHGEVHARQGCPA